ncbi:3-dehydroquinate synthase [bacterium]|nr:3-dehydroquinate synthase [bacterium]MBT4552853.1 3-dehydroquinate synthase [bacterium]MBT5988715.1 3-dehydroquinate synthase [bacterium]
MHNFTIKIKPKPEKCDVFVGTDLFEKIAEYLVEKKLGNYHVIITDSKVKELYAKTLLERLQMRDLKAVVLDFPEGEANKNRATKALLEDKMLKLGLGRDTVVIALGGGVVGDVAGFVASTYMRGVPCIQVPTTTVAQADSSYGGKTGIDVTYGKNLLGTFHNPRAVFVDINTLKTLDKKNYINGLVEVIKHGFIKSKKLYDFFHENKGSILNRKAKEYSKVMEELMLLSFNVKKEVIEKDHKEQNLRKILNYGHTIGHAIEKLSNYTLLHGQAVAIGIAVEAFMASKLGYGSKEIYQAQKNTLELMGLATKIPEKMSTKDIVTTTLLDKKARKGLPEFIFLENIGTVKRFVLDSVSITLELEVLEKMLNEYRKEFSS